MTDRARRFSLRSELLVAGLAAVVYGVPLYVSKSLLFGVTDLRGFVINMSRSRDAGQFFPGATGDFTRSLGISNYPISLLLDLPWLLATSVPSRLAQVAFGVTTCLALYAAVNVLGVVSRTATPVRQVAGFFLPLLMLLPGPVEWNNVARYTSTFGWTVATLTIALVILFATASRDGVATQALVFLCGCVVFLTNVSYLPMTLPVVLLAVAFGWTEHGATGRRRSYRRHCTTILFPAAIATPLFAGYYLFGVWAIPNDAVQENVDNYATWVDLGRLLLPFPTLEDSPLASSLMGGTATRITMTFVLLAAVWLAGKRGLAKLSRLGAWSLAALTAYSIVYYVAARFAGREIGLDPKYVEIVAYPAWILLIVNLLTLVPVPTTRIRRSVLRVLPAVVMVAWGAQWTLRNLDVRSQPAEYPVLLSSTALKLKELTAINHGSGHFSRTIIIQRQFSDERKADGFSIRRATDFTETFYLELSYLKIPVLNAYSHMISPRTFSDTNRLFGDGRPSWRQYSLYDVANVATMPPLGIEYVLSEVEIRDPGLELLSAEQYRAFGLFPTPNVAYLYRVSAPEPTASPLVNYSLTDDGLLIEGSSTRAASVIVPVEYSRCLVLQRDSSTSDVTMKRSPDGFVELSFDGVFSAELRYENALFQFRNCRIRDYLDFRKERGL